MLLCSCNMLYSLLEDTVRCLGTLLFHDFSPIYTYFCSRSKPPQLLLFVLLYPSIVYFLSTSFFISISLKYISSTLFTVYCFLNCRTLVYLPLRELPESFGRLGNLTTLCVSQQTLLKSLFLFICCQPKTHFFFLHFFNFLPLFYSLLCGPILLLC